MNLNEMTFYHGTSSTNIGLIVRHGLRASYTAPFSAIGSGKRRDPSLIYLSTKKDESLREAAESVARAIGGDPVIIEVDGALLVDCRMIGLLQNGDLDESVQCLGSLAYSISIPADCLTICEVRSNGSWEDITDMDKQCDWLTQQDYYRDEGSYAGHDALFDKNARIDSVIGQSEVDRAACVVEQLILDVKKVDGPKSSPDDDDPDANPNPVVTQLEEPPEKGDKEGDPIYTFTLSDVQGYYDIKLSSGLQPPEAAEATKDYFGLEVLQVNPLGRVMEQPGLKKKKPMMPLGYQTPPGNPPAQSEPTPKVEAPPHGEGEESGETRLETGEVNPEDQETSDAGDDVESEYAAEGAVHPAIRYARVFADRIDIGTLKRKKKLSRRASKSGLINEGSDYYLYSFIDPTTEKSQDVILAIEGKSIKFDAPPGVLETIQKWLSGSFIDADYHIFSMPALKMGLLTETRLLTAKDLELATVSSEDRGRYVINTQKLAASQDSDSGATILSAYTHDGAYIGSDKDANYLCNEIGIHPEKSEADDSVCSIGKSDKDEKWYGWSHRAIRGFGIGDSFPDTDTSSNREIETEDDAKSAAKAFALDVA